MIDLEEYLQNTSSQEKEALLGKAILLLNDVELIFPGSPGCGDLSRAQRTVLDIRRFLHSINRLPESSSKGFES